MKASEFPALMRELTIPGATVRPADGKSGSGLEHGFIVTGEHGGRMAWQVAIQEDGAKVSGTAVFPAAAPAQPDKLVTADIEASIAAWIGQSKAAEYVVSLELQSKANASVRGLRYGLGITLDTGGRVFIQPLWTLEPGEKPDGGNKYQIRDAV